MNDVGELQMAQILQETSVCDLLQLYKHTKVNVSPLCCPLTAALEKQTLTQFDLQHTEVRNNKGSTIVDQL